MLKTHSYEILMKVKGGKQKVHSDLQKSVITVLQ